MAPDARHELLDFDSELFGFPVARVAPDSLSAEELRQGLDALRASGVRLAFWRCAPTAANDEIASTAGGFLADERTTYARELGDDDAAWPTSVTRGGSDDASALIPLAIAAGEFSRYRVDPRIPDEVFHALYEQWMHRSLSGAIADATLVVRDGREVVAMTTIAVSSGRSQIGLVAVGASHRGRALGSDLVGASHAWARERGLGAACVVTQGRNTAARALYESCGYRVESVEHDYHFWLD